MDVLIEGYVRSSLKRSGSGRCKPTSGGVRLQLARRWREACTGRQPRGEWRYLTVILADRADSRRCRSKRWVTTVFRWPAGRSSTSNAPCAADGRFGGHLMQGAWTLRIVRTANPSSLDYREAQLAASRAQGLQWLTASALPLRVRRRPGQTHGRAKYRRAHELKERASARPCKPRVRPRGKIRGTRRRSGGPHPDAAPSRRSRALRKWTPER